MSGIPINSNRELPDFINHSCEPNCGMRDAITFIAMNDILDGEEISIDYAMINSGVASGISDNFECGCGHGSCRGQIRSTDWQLSELQRKYGSYFAPLLKNHFIKSPHRNGNELPMPSHLHM